MAAGVVHIPWYATLFRAQVFADALTEFAPTALRYGATDYRVYRSRDDEYKFTHMVSFEDKSQFEAYWYGPDFNQFRAAYSSYYQVPVLYVWQDLLVQGQLDEAPAAAGAPKS
jgi:quinol monooxygenase YgiN